MKQLRNYSDENFNILVKPNYPEIEVKEVVFNPERLFDTSISAELLKKLNGRNFLKV